MSPFFQKIVIMAKLSKLVSASQAADVVAYCKFFYD
jgi:hypothetical protein